MSFIHAVCMHMRIVGAKIVYNSVNHLENTKKYITIHRRCYTNVKLVHSQSCMNDSHFYCNIVCLCHSVLFTSSKLYLFRSALETIHHLFHSIYNCRRFFLFFRLIEMAIMQYFNGHNRHSALFRIISVSFVRHLNAIILNDEFIFQILLASRSKYTPKHICQIK